MAAAVAATVKSIRALIAKDLEVGDKLPSESDLVEMCGVSRATVREALTRLAAEGLVDRRWGVGTFVAEGTQRVAHNFHAKPFAIPGLIESTGASAGVESFTFEELPPAPDLFPAFPRTVTAAVTRTFSVDGVPAVVMRDRMIREVDGARADIESLASVDGLVKDILARIGAGLDALQLQLEAEMVDAEGARLLRMPSTEPVVTTRGWGIDDGGRRVVAIWGTYRTRVIRLGIESP